MAEDISLEKYGIRQGGVIEVQDALQDFVRRKFDDAVRHKQSLGIEAQLLRNLRANKGIYQPDEVALLGPFNDVYMGIPALKARAAESWLTDIILNNIDKPWTIDPTPMPELPDDLKELVVDQLIRELPGLEGEAAIRDRARQLKGAQASIAEEKAGRATDRMGLLIEDQFSEGRWQDVYAQFLIELTVYPTACIRAPVVISKAVGKWVKGEYKCIQESLPVTRVIPAFDCFPSPNSTSTQDGEHFCERAKFSQAAMHSYINVKGFNAGNIRQVLDRYPNGYQLHLWMDSERQRLEDKAPDGTVMTTTRPSGDLDTIIYNGKIRGELLADHGIIVKDKQASYECEIWVVGDYVVRAILNPNPTGRRPVHSTSYRKIAGSFWGQSVIDLTYDVGRICNAAARALVRNMGYSSGPIGEVVSERVTGTQDPTDISPYRIVLVEPDLSGTGGPAYKFHNIDSIAGDLLRVFEAHMKLADDLSGVPSYVLGNPQVAGAGRTLGGLSMLMGNAAKGIKNVQLNIDRDIIAPTVEGYYIFNMSTSKDDSIKADAKVVARGATGLLQRELAQTRTVELLQLLTPYIQAWDTLDDGIKVMLREVIKTTGLPVDKIIPDPNAGEDAMETMRLLTGPAQPGFERGTSSPVPLPAQSLPPPQAASGPPVPINLATGA